MNNTRKWEQVINFNENCEQKIMRGKNFITNLDVLICIGDTLNKSFDETKKLIKIFSLENNYKNKSEFFAAMKKYGKDIFETYNESGVLTSGMVKEVKDTFKEALRELNNDSLFKIGKTNKELVNWYINNFGADELKEAYELLGDFVNFNELAEDIYWSNYDIGKFENCYYFCPGVGIGEKPNF